MAFDLTPYTSPPALIGAVAGGLIGLGIAKHALDSLRGWRQRRLIVERQRLMREAMDMKPTDTRRAAKLREARRLTHEELRMTVR